VSEPEASAAKERLAEALAMRGRPPEASAAKERLSEAPDLWRRWK
jgi:hypothetical protein